MNTRTRTNVSSGKGLEGFIAVLKQYYLAGGLALVYEDKEDGRLLSKKLCCEDFHIVLLSLSEAKNAVLKENVRFIVGIGGCAVVLPVKTLAKGRRHAFFAKEIAYDYFFRGNFRTERLLDFAEFAYYDEDGLLLTHSERVCEGYATLFSLMTECMIHLTGSEGLPYNDKGLLGIFGVLKRFLVEGAEAENYFKDALRLIKTTVDALTERGVVEIFSERVQFFYGAGAGNRFLVDYFINLILIIFTKWNFCDMLIPSEALVTEVPLRMQLLPRKGECFLKKEELSVIAVKMRGMLRLPSLDKKALLTAFRQAVTKNTPLFAEISNRGILEGLLDYGEFKAN